MKGAGEYTKESHPSWKGGPAIMQCLQCGKKFTVAKSRVKVGWGKYCCRKCQSIHKTSRFSGKNNPNWKGGKIKKSCGVCGKDFFVIPSQRNARIFCSEKCQDKNHSINTRGANNSNWKGGISELSHAVRTSFQYLYWRQQVLIRDKFSCQKCGATGEKLNAHHIKHFHVLLKEARAYMSLFKELEAVMAYSPMWNINNGITLCDKCHKTEHSK